MKQRERFSSRLGFILISAGCAIGLGNVYRFPITAGAYGGAFFVLIYLAFLLLLGIPVMVAELALGRASKRSAATAFDEMEKPGQKWHIFKVFSIAGNYLLMMFYTTIAGWMGIYFFKYLSGGISSITEVGSSSTLNDSSTLWGQFGTMVASPSLLIIATFSVIIICFFVCSIGLQKGVERVTKVMMICLLALIVILAVHSCTLNGAGEGLKFYLVPSVENLKSAGVSTVIFSAMGQAFFTLSIGMGSIQVFGSYIDRDRSLLGEAFTITALDTFVALMSGLIIFPACFTYGNAPTTGEAGATFLFTTLSSLFNHMPGGRIWGSLFFLFMLFAALSTVIAVFENIVSFWLELTNLSRRKIAVINIALLMILSLPCIFGMNLWSDFKVLGKSIDGIEDFAVSNIILPLGSLVYILFCTSRYGWGWKSFISEANNGKGAKLPRWIRPYMSYALPVIVLVIFFISLI